MKTFLSRPVILISTVYFLLAVLYFSPLQAPSKLAYPLAFLTLCALRHSSWAMILAMGFSALGDYMGTCHNFWGQMGFFALAHIAFIVFFSRSFQKELGLKWKTAIVGLYGIVIGMCILPHVVGVLQIAVSLYVLLILSMCILAWMQKNLYYAIGAWLFVFSDTILAWNKFVSSIEWAGYLIMVPYYLGQWVLFVQSIRHQQHRPI